MIATGDDGYPLPGKRIEENIINSPIIWAPALKTGAILVTTRAAATSSCRSARTPLGGAAPRVTATDRGALHHRDVHVSACSRRPCRDLRAARRRVVPDHSYARGWRLPPHSGPTRRSQETLQ